MTPELRNFLQDLILAGITAMIPTLAYIAFRLGRVGYDYLRSKLSIKNQVILDAVARTVVQAAEQRGVSKQITNEAGAKKRDALQAADRYLKQFGIDLDEAAIDSAIEAAVKTGVQHESYAPYVAPTTDEELKAILRQLLQDEFNAQRVQNG